MNRLCAEVELEKSVRRLRETFHGKIPVDKATVLMRRYGNNHRVVAMDIILMKERDLDEEDRDILQNDEAARNVVQRLEAEEQEAAAAQARQRQPRADARRGPRNDEDITELVDRLRVLPLTRKNLRMFDDAQRNLIPSDVHQFACERCDIDWWRSVPQRKSVSRCQKCKKKYDPVPEDKRWGIAEFHCPNCTRMFRGFGQMNVGSPCYSCHSLVTPTKILPPKRRNIGPRQNPHSCLAEDCYNRQEPHVPGTQCIHPRSRMRNHKPRVLYPSTAHVSSGSTVNTCLSQGSLVDLYQLILEDIREERRAELEEDQEEDNSDTEAISNSSTSTRD